MRIDEMLAVLAALDEAACPTWVAGGWGVDALVGRQTREHRDLDLLVRADDEARVLHVLALRGYVVETDWRPVRVELRAEGRRWVDVHPVAFDSTGHGLQAGPDGTSFDYPPQCLTTGSLAGVQVRCLSAQRQVELHSGYEPRDVDHADLALLRTLPA